MDRRDFLKLGGAGIFGATMLGVMGSTQAMAQSSSSLASEFRAASDEYGVPLELLLAMGYVSTRWTMPPESSGEYSPGDIHGMGGYGVMSLSDDPDNETLARAQQLTNIPEDKLKNDRASNILGAAAVLSALQESSGASRDDLDAWYDVASAYGDGDIYANQVYETLQEGVSEEVGGEELGFEGQDVEDPEPMYSRSAAATDYQGAKFYGAHSGNYSQANRPSSNRITKVVIHVMQGSWSSAINWFNDSRAGVSCHYNIRSSDGFIGQSVKEEDIAYHAGHWPTNQNSVGIEHEGYVSEPGRWFTDAMYRSSAKLTANLCRKYSIAINRTNIIGHADVPGCSGSGGGAGCHTDPGGGWDWDRYMNLVREFAGSSDKAKNPNDVIVDNGNAGRFRASTAWDRNTFNSQKYGANYCAAQPSTTATDPARFKVGLPSRGRYKVYMRWPAASGYNPATTVRIKTTGGLITRVVNQRQNGGKWMLLGTFAFAAGEDWRVSVLKKSQSEGYVIADAVRFVKAS